MAENSYYTQWKAATMNTSSPLPGVTSPARVSAEVIAEITLGCSTCAANANPQTDPNLSAYPFNPSSGGAGRSF